MSTLRVAIDLRLAGYRVGGTARYAEELYRALQRRDDVTVRGLRSRRDTVMDANAHRMRTPPHHRFEQRAIAAELLLGRMRPDVYHATDFIAPRLRGISTVATVHDLEFLRHPEYLDEAGLKYYRQLEQSRVWTDAWITPSQWTADDLSVSFDIDPASIFPVPHGLPPTLALRPAVPRHERNPYLLLVGTVEPRKRYGLLLDALARMEQPPRVVLVGQPGWQSDDVLARISKNAYVDWRKDVNDSTLWELYRNAFAVVVPSQSEGFGLAALEAMACGTPVVSSGHGALPEVTGLAALVPETDDPVGWADAVQKVLEDEHLWNELSVFGQRRAREFSWDRAAGSTLQVYQHVSNK